MNPVENPVDLLMLVDELGVLCLAAIGPLMTPTYERPKTMMTPRNKTPRITPITIPATVPPDKPKRSENV